MRKGGLEPPRVASHAPQTCASTSSATSARGSFQKQTNKRPGPVQVGSTVRPPPYLFAGLALDAGDAAGVAGAAGDAAGAAAPPCVGAAAGVASPCAGAARAKGRGRDRAGEERAGVGLARLQEHRDDQHEAGQDEESVKKIAEQNL